MTEKPFEMRKRLNERNDLETEEVGVRYYLLDFLFRISSPHISEFRFALDFETVLDVKS